MVGSELTPELKVRLSIDERGKVTDVEVLTLEPSSEFDALLTADIAEQLGRWRFAPATEDAGPVASRLELRVQYRSSPAGQQSWDDEAQESFFFGEPDRRSADVLRLPLAERKRIVDRLAAVAEKHLQSGQRRRAESPRFVAVSDAQDEKLVETLAGNLEAAYGQFLEVFAPHLEPQPERYKIVAYMFSTRAAFEATQVELRDSTVGVGFYSPPGFLAFHQEAFDAADILTTMVHETFHAFSDRALRHPGRLPHLWLEEGLAQYFGNSQIKKGRLVPGKTVQRRMLLHYGRAFKLRTRANLTVQDIKRAVGSGEAPGLAQLLRASRQEFYGEAIHLYYGTSWLLLHFLRHGEPGWQDAQFPKALLYLVEGYPAETTLEAVYGAGLEELEARFRAYVGDF